MIGGSAFTRKTLRGKSWYSKQFLSTEINGTFYRTPSLEAVQTWRDRTLAKFRFAWKASKFITHWKRLSVRSENSIELLVSCLAILGDEMWAGALSTTATISCRPRTAGKLPQQAFGYL